MSTTVLNIAHQPLNKNTEHVTLINNSCFTLQSMIGKTVVPVGQKTYES